ncbi:MAG: hypothetical protein LBI38_07115 [Oscillospiraceae bacterium]|jgi:hypothetical protein|nr:hypothetical protein [Oscillospiraceae bacterium]
MRCNYREHRYYCGEFLDVQVYPVYRKAGVRGARAKPTSDIQAKLNAENSIKRLTRLIHTNFTRDDYALHLTYRDDEMPADDLAAKKNTKNFLARAKRLYSSSSAGLIKYILVTEKSDKGRYHHHLIVSGGQGGAKVDRTALERCWGKGYANTKALQFTDAGLSGLARYITKKPLFFKRWSCSRGLKKPVEKIRDGRFSGKKAAKFINEIAPPFIGYDDAQKRFAAIFGDYSLVNFKGMYNNFNGGAYISAIMRKRM